MTITFKTVARGYNPSNKIPIKTKETYSWAYKYEVTGGGTVQVSAPVIDKVSITVPVHNAGLKKNVATALKNAEAGNLSKDFAKAWDWSARKDYWIAINCKTTEGQTVLVQALPKKSKGHLIRLEFNPAKQWKWGLGVVKGDLSG